MKTLRWTGPKMEPWRTLIVSSHQPDVSPLLYLLYTVYCTYLNVCTFQAQPIPPDNTCATPKFLEKVQHPVRQIVHFEVIRLNLPSETNVSAVSLWLQCLGMFGCTVHCLFSTSATLSSILSLLCHRGIAWKMLQSNHLSLEFDEDPRMIPL